MRLSEEKRALLQGLQREITLMQGGKAIVPFEEKTQGRFGPLETAFPGLSFPTSAVHEFISQDSGQAAATEGFMTALAGRLMGDNGVCLWVGSFRNVFPPALGAFGISTERIIFVDPPREKDVLWIVEQGLKSAALSVVIGEAINLSFTESQRLMLAVEDSQVTGLIHRFKPRTENTVACTTRWKIAPVASIPEEGMPGFGFPSWSVHLEKVRNGRPANWLLEWDEDRFKEIVRTTVTKKVPVRKAG